MTEDYEEIQVNLDYTGTNNDFSKLDRFGRVTDQVWNDYGADPDVVLDEYTYTYDRVGNRTSRDNELDSDFDEDYIYDDLYRLTDFDRADGFDQSWDDLDVLGNWSTFDNDGTSQTREVNEANEIEKIDGSPNDVAYDAAGNMIEVPKLDGSGEHFCLKYDAWNRLAAVYDDNGTTLIAKYEYDAAGRRIEKETYSGGSLDEARHYYYGGTWQCIEERVEASGVLPGDADVQYVWGAKYVDNLILRDRDTDADGAMDERLYALADANYNVTALFDEATGTVVERFVYDAYGNVTELDPDDFTAYTGTDYDWEYTYTTRRLDDETGLMYYRHRYYDADLGQFVSRDPIGYWAGDGNLYRYVGGSPMVFVDPSGLQLDDPFTIRVHMTPNSPYPADGKYGRPLAVTQDEAWDMVHNMDGMAVTIDTSRPVAGGFIFAPHGLGLELQRQRGVVPPTDLQVAAQGGIAIGPTLQPPKISVLEIGYHANPWEMVLGPKGNPMTHHKINDDGETFDAFIGVLKAHLDQPCMIVLAGCNTGNLVSSECSPSWVQKLATLTGCTVLATGGFFDDPGSFVVEGPGAGVHRFSTELDAGTPPAVIQATPTCYGSKDNTVYVFRPRKTAQ